MKAHMEEEGKLYREGWTRSCSIGAGDKRPGGDPELRCLYVKCKKRRGCNKQKGGDSQTANEGAPASAAVAASSSPSSSASSSLFLKSSGKIQSIQSYR